MTAARDQPSSMIDRSVLEAEVRRLVGAGEKADVALRVLGSIGVAMHSHDAAKMIPSFERTYADIDLATYQRNARAVGPLFERHGYHPDPEVFVASEGRRSIFEDPTRRIHVDVFYDRLEFCHVIPLVGRLEADSPTIPIAELLLSKLQIIRINEKDVIDVILLLLDHPLGATDEDTIDVERIARLCSDDWGLWRTLTQNLQKVRDLAPSYAQLDAQQRSHVERSAEAIKMRIDTQPKSVGWRMRDRVGVRRQWWTDVDEVR